MPEPVPWNPSKSTRILIGIGTLWPPIYFVFFMASIGLSFVLFGKPSHKPPSIDVFKYLFPLHCFTMLLSFGLTAVYIVHAVRNAGLRQEMRLIWIIVLFMGNMFAFPVYWWLYLRPGLTTPIEGSSSSQPPGSQPPASPTT
jgi:hypothetical protein